MNYFKAGLISLLAFVFTPYSSADDGALYDKKPSKESSFVRLINVENHIRTITADSQKIASASPGGVTGYAPIDKGIYTFKVGNFSLEVNVPEKSKLSFFVKDNKLTHITQPRNNSKRTATISLFNLSDALVSLEAGKSKKAVLKDIDVSSVKSRSVNPMKLSFHVSDHASTSLETPSITLKRGIDSDIFIYNGLMSKALLLTESEW
ncbi:alginate O-acetyltransferase AlgF [Enterovibrio calviensis]|uniref:alginate O-acetyltransferase AlgF n=1 Tax=Enterovibrio calviensis TaxID=91359 RepID=UPI0037367D9E